MLEAKHFFKFPKINIRVQFLHDIQNSSKITKRPSNLQHELIRRWHSQKEIIQISKLQNKSIYFTFPNLPILTRSTTPTSS